MVSLRRRKAYSVSFIRRQNKLLSKTSLHLTSLDSHADTVTRFLKGAHVVISARNEVRRYTLIRRQLSVLIGLSTQADVSPEVIMARVNNASGSKYSVQKEAPRKYEPITPVGTSYTPVGQVDIAQLRKGAPKDIPQSVVSIIYPTITSQCHPLI